MKHLKSFDINENNSTNFESEKKKTIQMIDDLLKQYDGLSRMVSPKNWRATGTHFTELKNMKDEISDFTEITYKEINIPWVEEELRKK